MLLTVLGFIFSFIIKLYLVGVFYLDKGTILLNFKDLIFAVIFYKAVPAVKLVSSNFADRPAITQWTASHHVASILLL